MKVRTIVDVVEGQLCTGCGACASVLPDTLEMVDDLEVGRRPRLRPGKVADDTRPAMSVCPGPALEHGAPPPGADASLVGAWGPVLEVWEGHAADPAIRFRGSSGGVGTALAVDGLANQGLHGVLHITARPDAPLLNHTVLSTSMDEVVAAAGSRYAPASPCDSLHLIEEAAGPSMFIGKPCDVAALQRARRHRPALDEKVAVTIGIFCAGTPSLRGTLDMLKRLGVDDPRDVTDVRYRGNGWPGRATLTVRTSTGTEERSLSYAESWGETLQVRRQWRCYVCPDHTGEFADLAVGDPWYRPVADDEEGRSLIVVRTERGRAFLAAALAAGTVVAERVDHALLPASQPNLLEVRGAIWGRITVLRLLGAAVPRFKNMPTFPSWWRLPLKDRAQSLYGTLKRVFVKGLRRRRPVVALDETPYRITERLPEPRA